MSEELFESQVTLMEGDCLEKLKELDDNSVDSVVTDPPYELTSGKNSNKGFMGKEWDGSGIAFNVDMWKEVLRVLKPGGHLLSFGGSRTYHRMAVAIEDAGFEIRDQIMWTYGCLSEDTEILTENGWERYHKNIYNSHILTFDVENEIFEWHKPRIIFNYPNEHTAYSIRSDSTDQIVSRNHRVLIEQNGNYVFKRAEELAWEQEISVPILEDMPELFNDFFCDGQISSGEKQILLKGMQGQTDRSSQHREDGYGGSGGYKDTMSYLRKRVLETKLSFRSIKEPLLLLPMQWGSPRGGVEKTRSQRKEELVGKERTRVEGTNDRKYKSSLEGRSDIFQDKRQLYRSQICEMPKKIHIDGEKRWVCDGTQIEDGEEIGSVSIKEGSRSSHRSQSIKQRHKQLDAIREQFSTQEIRSTRAKITPIKYDGNVWCVNVPNGCFVARRNGKVFLTGNSGFPKSHNIGKAVDELQGNECEVVGYSDSLKGRNKSNKETFGQSIENEKENPFKEQGYPIEKGNSDFEGWGTALKPAHEPIVLARKPLSEDTIAKNCLKWGTGGLNIDACRVGTETRTNSKGDQSCEGKGWGMKDLKTEIKDYGRFPANLIHDGSDVVVKEFPITQSTSNIRNNNASQNDIYGDYGASVTGGFDDEGSAARYFKQCGFTVEDYPPFFYCAKAGKEERNLGCEVLEKKPKPLMGEFKNNPGRETPKSSPTPRSNYHPTVKPIELMEYLTKLITPKHGVVLDPLMGSGTTGVACVKNRFSFIGIDMTPEYVNIARARIEYHKGHVVVPLTEYFK